MCYVKITPNPPPPMSQHVTNLKNPSLYEVYVINGWPLRCLNLKNSLEFKSIWRLFQL